MRGLQRRDELTGTRDVAPPETSRIYMVSSAPHIVGAFPPGPFGDKDFVGQAAMNPLVYAPILRAVFRALDAWVAEALAGKDLDTLLDYRVTAPGLAYAHPTVDHFVPLFIALGASLDANSEARTQIDGYWMANSKRSLQFA